MIFVDTNIVLELLLERSKQEKVLEALRNHKGLVLSTLSVSHIMYFVEKSGVDQQTSKDLMYRFSLLSVVDQDAARAFDMYGGEDFEDALQVACAMRYGCTKFLTLDQSLAKKYAKTMKIKLIQ
jgi:predicted nucleic acid-binding protein